MVADDLTTISQACNSAFRIPGRIKRRKDIEYPLKVIFFNTPAIILKRNGHQIHLSVVTRAIAAKPIPLVWQTTLKQGGNDLDTLYFFYILK